MNLALVERALREDPYSFEFFTAVRLLELLRPDRSSVGGHGDPADEVVRFAVHESLAFPASEIQSLELNEHSPARMTVNFMGLTGPSGLLPYVYTQQVIERIAAKDSALADFLDLFHHRMLSLFFNAWEKHRFMHRYERQQTDPLTEHLRDLGGLGGDERIGPVRAQSLAGYVGILGPEPRGAVALEQLLADFFDVPVAVEQFFGGWYPVPLDDQCALDDEPGFAQLGHNVLVGDEVWDPQARVRIRLGPLTRSQFECFLPDGAEHDTLRTLVRLFSHDQFEFELQLVLLGEDVEGLELGAEAANQRLGWSTWIRTAPLQCHADQTVFTL